MPPLNLTRDVVSPLIREINDSTIAKFTATDAHEPIAEDFTQPRRNSAKITAIIVTVVILGIIFVILMRTACQKSSDDADPENPAEDPALAPGHVYGHDYVASHALDTLRYGRSLDRPSFQHVEDRGSGGSVVARPAPAVAHGSDEQDEPLPPPPCK